MTASVWDDPDLRAGGDYFSFNKVGDNISGKINAVRSHRFADGTVAPQLFLTTDSGEEKTVTCGAVRLKMELLDLRPDAGDHISITLAQEEKRGGGKTLRHWDVNVTKGGSKPAAAARALTDADQRPPAVDTAAAAAALANLSPEQKAALGL